MLSKRLGLPAERIVKLDANENPYGPLPAVLEAIAEYNYYHIYPDPQQTELREALAASIGVPAANILPSHGADELLDYLCRLCLRPGDAIVDCPPTFGMYSFDAQLAGAQVIEVWRKADFAVDVAGIEQAVAARAVSLVTIVTRHPSPVTRQTPLPDLAQQPDGQLAAGRGTGTAAGVACVGGVG